MCIIPKRTKEKDCNSNYKMHSYELKLQINEQHFWSICGSKSSTNAFYINKINTGSN